MKSRKSAASCCVVAAMFLSAPLLAPSPAEDGTGQAAGSQLKELLDRIEKLESRVAELEKTQALAVLPTRQAPNPLPKGSVPQQINWIEYYIIPVVAPNSATGKPER